MEIKEIEIIKILQEENSRLESENRKLEKENERYACVAGILLILGLCFFLFGVPWLTVIRSVSGV